jgi:hypothetical protein
MYRAVHPRTPRKARCSVRDVTYRTTEVCLGILFYNLVARPQYGLGRAVRDRVVRGFGRRSQGYWEKERRLRRFLRKVQDGPIRFGITYAGL